MAMKNEWVFTVEGVEGVEEVEVHLKPFNLFNLFNCIYVYKFVKNMLTTSPLQTLYLSFDQKVRL